MMTHLRFPPLITNHRSGVTLTALKQFAAPEERRTSTTVRRNDSSQVVAQLAAAAGMTQTTERLGLNLADALPGDAKLLAYLFQGI